MKQRRTVSQLSALRDEYLHLWSLRLAVSPDMLDLLHYVHSLCNLTEDDVMVVQPWRRFESNEELAAVRILARVLRLSVISRRYESISALTAMDKRPSWSCFKLKFSSSNLGPYMLVHPVPLP